MYPGAFAFACVYKLCKCFFSPREEWILKVCFENIAGGVLRKMFRGMFRRNYGGITSAWGVLWGYFGDYFRGVVSKNLSTSSPGLPHQALPVSPATVP